MNNLGGPDVFYLSIFNVSSHHAPFSSCSSPLCVPTFVFLLPPRRCPFSLSLLYFPFPLLSPFPFSFLSFPLLSSLIRCSLLFSALTTPRRSCTPHQEFWGQMSACSSTTSRTTGTWTTNTEILTTREDHQEVRRTVAPVGLCKSLVVFKIRMFF